MFKYYVSKFFLFLEAPPCQHCQQRKPWLEQKVSCLMTYTTCFKLSKYRNVFWGIGVVLEESRAWLRKKLISLLISLSIWLRPPLQSVSSISILASPKKCSDIKLEHSIDTTWSTLITSYCQQLSSSLVDHSLQVLLLCTYYTVHSLQIITLCPITYSHIVIVIHTL